MRDSSIHNWAKKYIEAGFRIFPVSGVTQGENDQYVCTCKNGSQCGNLGGRPGKHPRTSHGYLDATTDPAQIDRWFGSGGSHIDCNIALRTGDGLTVLDIDPRHDGLETLDNWSNWVAAGWNPPVTRRQRTGSGGLHLLYRTTPGLKIKSRDALLPGVDIKSDGGYIIVAPSLHICGDHYRWENWDDPISPAGDDLQTWMLTSRGGKFRSSGHGGETPEEYDFNDGGRAGQRDAFLNDLAFRLRKSGVSWERALEKIRRAWEECDQPENDYLPWEVALEKIRRVWSTIEPDVSHDDPRLGWARSVVASHSNSDIDTDEIIVNDGSVSEEDNDLNVVIGQPVIDDHWSTSEHMTDAGNGRRFVRLYGNQVRYCADEGLWYIWDGVRFCVDRKNHVFHMTYGVIADIRDQANAEGSQTDDGRALARWALKTESVAAREQMLKSARTDPAIAVTADQLDADPDVLVVSNGCINLKTSELCRSDPGGLATRSCATHYDHDATCPRWLEHVRLVTQGDQNLAAFLQRAAGYSLTGRTSEQKFMFLHGDGSNGKNVFIETIIDMLGDYGARAPETLIMSGRNEHSTELASLRGVRALMVDETGAKCKINDARLKMLTGSTKIKARYMRREFFEFESSLTLWMLGNNRPQVSDTTSGMWRRMRLVPFNAVIGDDRRVANYGAILQEEWPGILNWCLEGAKQWYEIDALGDSEAIRSATDEYRADEDVFGQFLSEYVWKGIDWMDDNVMKSFMSSSEIYAAYQMWCFSSGIARDAVISKRSLGVEMRRRGYEMTRVRGIRGFFDVK